MTGALAWVVLSSDSSSEFETFLFLCLAFGGGLYAIYWGFDRWKLSRLMADTPTEKVRSMAAGRTELQGTVAAYERTIDTPYAEDCVYVDWKVEHYDYDDDGSNWETVASGTDALPFYLDDGTGRALIRADVDDPLVDINDGAHTHTETYGSGQSAPQAAVSLVSSESTYGDGLLGSVRDIMSNDPLRTGEKRRYSQSVLPVGSDVYVFGGAVSRSEATMVDGQEDLLELRRHDGTDEFLISDTTEDELTDDYSKAGPFAVVGGLLVSAVALYFLLSWYVL